VEGLADNPGGLCTSPTYLEQYHAVLGTADQWTTQMWLLPCVRGQSASGLAVLRGERPSEGENLPLRADPWATPKINNSS